MDPEKRRELDARRKSELVLKRVKQHLKSKLNFRRTKPQRICKSLRKLQLPDGRKGPLCCLLRRRPIYEYPKNYNTSSNMSRRVPQTPCTPNTIPQEPNSNVNWTDQSPNSEVASYAYETNIVSLEELIRQAEDIDKMPPYALPPSKSAPVAPPMRKRHGTAASFANYKIPKLNQACTSSSNVAAVVQNVSSKASQIAVADLEPTVAENGLRVGSNLNLSDMKDVVVSKNSPADLAVAIKSLKTKLKTTKENAESRSETWKMAEKCINLCIQVERQIMACIRVDTISSTSQNRSHPDPNHMGKVLHEIGRLSQEVEKIVGFRRSLIHALESEYRGDATDLLYRTCVDSIVGIKEFDRNNPNCYAVLHRVIYSVM